MPTTPTAKEELEAFVANPLLKIVARLGKNEDAADLPKIDSATVQESNFPGYLPVELKEWQVEPGETADCAQANSELAEFTAGPIVDAQRATLCYLTTSYNGEAHKLWQWWPLPQPIMFRKEGNKFAYHGKILNVPET